MSLRRALSSPSVFLIAMFAVVLAALAQRDSGPGRPHSAASPAASQQPLGLPPGPLQTIPPFGPRGANHLPGPDVPGLSLPPDPLNLLAGAQGKSHTSSRHASFVPGSADASSIFLEASAYNSNGEAYSVAVADMNGDGHPDLLVANLCPSSSTCGSGVGTVDVLLGNGDGTFQAAISYNSGGVYAYSVAVADVNGDGHPDLLVANECASTSTCSNGGALGVLLGNGDGTFQAAVSYNSGGEYAYWLAVADVNGDGKPDLLVANQYVSSSNTLTGGVSSLLGNGDGTFQAAVSYTSGGEYAFSVAVADVNGDGHPDLLVANQCISVSNCTNGAVGMLLGNGDGTFQAAVSYNSGGLYAKSVAVADVNGDGQPDLLVANQCTSDCTGGTVDVLLGNGDGTFQAAVSYNSGGAYTYSIASADLNGDGHPDLLVANECASGGNCANGSVGVLLGNGDGTFQAVVSYNSGGEDAFSVAVADVNGDGRPDLLVANECAESYGQRQICSSGSASVLLGRGDGTFQAAVNDVTGGWVAYSVAVADVNGDGKPDLLVANLCPSSSGSCSNSTVSVLLSNGDGTFQAPVSYNSSGEDAYSVAVADVNGDGKPDLLVANLCASSSNCSNGAVSVLLGNGDGTFQAPVSYNSGGQDAYSVAVADVNGDGKPDLLVANECASSNCSNGTVGVLLGNGDGTFQAAMSYNSGGDDAFSIAAADVNSDGKPDLLVANLCASSSNCSNGAVNVLLGNGDGTFQAAVSYNSDGAYPYSVAVADLNGDGKPDLLVANECASTSTCSNGGALSVLLGNGDGTFQAAQISLTPSELSIGQIAVSDFNGDGKLDAAIGSGSVLLLGNGDGTFQVPLNLGAGGPGAAVGDFNGDGRPDLAVGGVTVLLNIASGFHYATSATVTSSANPANVGNPVTFTATVTPAYSVGALTGSVTFYDGVNALSTVAISNGQAEFSTSSLALGAHSITAGYAGDPNYLASTSPILSEVVNTTVTTTTLTSSLNPSSYNQSLTFTANVSSASGTPTGTVTFTDGATLLGTSTLAGGGNAAISVSSLTAGTHSITASYGGDSNFATSSANISQVVNQASSTISVLSSLNPAVWGQSITLSASLGVANGAVATGTVTFYDGATTLGSGIVTGNNATLTLIGQLSAGMHTITASYSGDANVSTSASTAFSQTVNQATTTIVLTSSVNPSYPNQTVYFAPQWTSQYGGTMAGTVTFKQGATILATLPLGTPFSTSFPTTGARFITAVYSGDNDNLGSTSPAFRQVVNALPATTVTQVTSSGSPSFVSQSVTFTSMTTSTYGVIPNGETVTFYDGTTAIGTGVTTGGVATFTTSALAVKTHTIKATYSGDASFKTSSGTVKQVVVLYVSATGVSSDPNPSTYGQSVGLMATVTSNAPAGPTGTVTFKNGATAIGTAIISGGTALLATTKLPAGMLNITANYNGDAQSSKSSGTSTQTVNQATTITTVSSSRNPSTAGQMVKFTATVTSSTTTPVGTVTFMDGSTVIGTGTLAGGKASYSTSTLASGSHNITAAYGGTTNITGSTSTQLVQVVN